MELVCEIPRSFERSIPSNFRTQGSFIHINSGKIFERDLVSSDSAAKSLNLGFSETEMENDATADSLFSYAIRKEPVRSFISAEAFTNTKSIFTYICPMLVAGTSN